MKRAAGLDLGRVRVGLAVADELGMLAHPRPFLEGGDRRRLFEHLKELCRDEDIGVLVVGLPIRLDGLEGPEARRARRFAGELAQATGVQVELVDERMTTVEARQRLREQGLSDRRARGRIDSAAAAVLLQSWLDAKRGETSGPA